MARWRPRQHQTQAFEPRRQTKACTRLSCKVLRAIGAECKCALASARTRLRCVEQAQTWKYHDYFQTVTRILSVTYVFSTLTKSPENKTPVFIHLQIGRGRGVAIHSVAAWGAGGQNMPVSPARGDARCPKSLSVCLRAVHAIARNARPPHVSRKVKENIYSSFPAAKSRINPRSAARKS